MPSLAPHLISIAEAAKYLGVSIATLRRWDNDSSFKATFVSPGKHRFYSIADLEKQTKGLVRIAQEWASTVRAHEPESEFYCETSDRFKTRLEKFTAQLEAHPTLNPVASLISSAAGEIGNNSYDHNLGNWPDIIGTFFSYDIGKRIVVLADRGVGVRTTLQKIRPALASDIEALRVAFTEFVTGRAPEHRGNGLKYVRDALIAAHAALWFQSGDAIFEIKKGAPDFLITTTDAAIQGSLAVIKF